jgi:hypothetical protein
MNRIQFWILTALSSLVVILLVAQIFEKRYSIYEQNLFTVQQQKISQGQACAQNWRLLGTAIVQQSQKNSDSALKDLIIRQSLLPSAPSDSSGSTNSAPAPASTGTPSSGAYQAPH